MRHIASSYDHHVLSVVVSGMEVNNHIACNLSNVIYVTENGLAHHVFSVDVVVYIFH